MTLIYSDTTLSRRMERAEARANADFVETRARLEPSIGATWVNIGGAYAMFDGVDSPCTQTFGLGLFDEITDTHLDEIEKFFIERRAPVFHEVSPMADATLMRLLNKRRYQPVELTSAMYREVGLAVFDQGTSDPRISTRVIRPEEVDLWARTSAAGWATESADLAAFMFNFGQISAQCAGSYPYLAELDGAAISTGMMFVHGEIDVLAGASTIPEARNQGAQNSLLQARLLHAARLGCSLVIMGASPGSQSQKNAQNNGFNIAYTRTKWQLIG